MLAATALAAAACGTTGAAMDRDRVDLANGVSAWTPGVLAAKRARYADVDVTVDSATVSAEDRAVLKPLLEAAAVVHRLFWQQVAPDAVALRGQLDGVPGGHGRALRDYADLNVGVWDRLDGDAPFYGTAAKPEGAAFYPADLSKAAFEAWIRAHPADRDAFESPFTVIRRDGPGLKAVPYHEAWRADLEEAAAFLRAAAAATSDPHLKRFLDTRAAALLTDDFFESDLAWMDLGAPGSTSAIEVTIGPYEVYEDGLFNDKASYEAFVTLRDAPESRKLAMIGGLLDELEANLPLDDRHKNFSRGKVSPIEVVNVIATSGDANHGVQTTAFNLPNDERVRAAKGSKKVLLKNVGEAKFRNSLIPIANRLLDPALLPAVTFDAYFNGILMHEVSHGLGPGFITLPDGTRTSVNAALKETYSTLEECKADVLGVVNTLYLVRTGRLPADLGPKTEAAYLAGIFRSVRFGVGDAHGGANLVQFDFLRQAGAITRDGSGRFGIATDRFEPAVRALARELLVIQAEGDRAAAKAFLERYGKVPAELTDALAKLAGVPVDIHPRYPLADALMRE
jgi:hypothetical protein